MKNMIVSPLKPLKKNLTVEKVIKIVYDKIFRL